MSTNTTVRFQPGITYYCRSICDHNCIYTVKVLSRTEKTIKALVDGTKAKTLRIAIYRDVEQVKPHGTYSMCAIVGADHAQPMEVAPHGHIYNDPTCACSHCVTRRMGNAIVAAATR
jgi:hypothetical protein